MVSNESSLGEDLGQAASAVGAAATEVGQFLGLVEEDLIPGNASVGSELAEHLDKLAAGFERAGQGFQAIDTGSWTGEAAEAARTYLEQSPPKWFHAADAFEQAGSAVREYQRVLAESQAKAARAKAELESAEQESAAAAERHDARADQHNATLAAEGPPPPAMAPFSDPAAEKRARAQQTIRQAQDSVQAAGDRAANAVLAACEHAPAEPGLLTRLKENLTDGAEVTGRIAGSTAAGAGEAVAGIAGLARLVNPLDPYAITHPQQHAEAVSTVAMGVVGAFGNPHGAAKTTVDIDGWRNDPARTLGSSIPDALLSMAGGAGVASRTARGVRTVADQADRAGHTAAGAPRASSAPSDLHAPPWASRDLPPTRPAGAGAGWGRWPEPGLDGQRLHTPAESVLVREPAHPDPPSGTVGHAPDGSHAPDPGVRTDEPGPGFRATEDDHQAYREQLEPRIRDSWEHNMGDLRARYPELDHLPDAEAMAVRRYVGSDANMINQAMRDGDPQDLDYLGPEISTMQSGFRRLPDVEPGAVPAAFRNIAVESGDLPELLARYEPGTVVEEKAFTSASKDLPPDYFGGAGGKEPVRFTVDNPRHAKDLEFMNPDEREIVFPDGNRFEVADREFHEGRGRGEWHIRLRDRGRPEETPDGP